MKLLASLVFLLLFNCTLSAQQHERVSMIDKLCYGLEAASNCQNEITIDSSSLSIHPYVIKFYRSNSSQRLSFVHYQLLKPFVSIKYFYQAEKLIKVAVIDRSTGTTLQPNLYFEDGKLIYLTHKSVDGDNSGNHFLSKSKEYLLYFQLNNKAL